MDKALKTKWLEALRSGKYKQGRYGLRSEDDRFCCLGVLCDISGLGEWEDLPRGGYIYKRREEGDDGGLPQFLHDSANMTYQQEDRLMGMNDIDGLNFPEIADWIEENIEEE